MHINKKNNMAMILIMISGLIGVFTDTSTFLKILSGVITAVALSLLLGWLPIKKDK